MTNFTLDDLPVEIVAQLNREAKRRGITVERMAGIILELSVGQLSTDDLDERIDERLVESRRTSCG